MNDAGVINDGAVVIKGDRIAAVGTIGAISKEWMGDLLALPGTSVIPGLVDPHAHPVFGGSRINEFILRGRGASYQEIHAAGGGILSTVRATREASDEELERRAHRVVERMIAHGTTTLEAKSGYGLDLETELRMLRLLARLESELPIDIVPTFLGAHTMPSEYANDREGYLRLVTEVVLPRVAQEKLARYCDVFCEDGAFSLDESRRILSRAKELGLGLRIHAEQFKNLGGARMAAELGAATADHLEALPEEDFAVLREHGTIPVLIPGSTFFLHQGSYAPARAMLAADLCAALGTDFNAGSCQTESMGMALSLAVIKLRLTPEEALVAATVNAAHSLGLGAQVGSLEPGKKADMLILDAVDWREMVYHFGVNLVRVVIKNGTAVNTILTSPLGGPL